MEIALLGMGTIGSGVFQLLKERKDIHIRRILDRRNLGEAEALRTERMEDILEDDQIEAVVELLGGVSPAWEYARRTLEAGKHLVSANKLMVGSDFGGLLAAARGGVQLRISASVGGGIPFLPNLIRARRVDEITSLGGVVNGTTNYILDTMQREGADLAEALAQAQAAGYAEADPSADLDGIDARAKLSIAASVAFDGMVSAEGIPTEGIRRLRRADVARFREMGLVCRLLAGAEREAGRVRAWVEPTLLPWDAPEACVRRNDNYIRFTLRRGGPLAFAGQGAGREPTACAVVGDLVDLAEGAAPAEYVRGGPLTLEADGGERRYFVRSRAPLPFPGEPLGEGCFLTGEVPPLRMHAAAAKMRRADPETFFAGLREGR